MTRRLPSQPGEWIDRSKPVEFSFEGQRFSGYQGDVLCSALWAGGQRILGRSFKYHRPRGVYSLAGHDIACMVEDVPAARPRRTNMRGDILPITPNLNVNAVNTAGGVQRDRLNITEKFSAFLPVGFYYKAFHTPRCLFHWYEKKMRNVAGLGSIEPSNPPTASPKDYAFCDLLVVGSGPAGLAGALAAAEQGAKVMLVDEQPQLGGSLAWQWGGDEQARKYLAETKEKLSAMSNVTVRCSTMAAGHYDDHWVALVDEVRLTKLRAKSVLIATGCMEQPAVFRNNDVPGVMLGSAAQRLIRLYGVKPFERGVVLAANAQAYQVALDLLDAGVTVAAVVDLRPDGETTPIGAQVADKGVTIHKGHCVYEALVGGDKTVSGVVICPIDAKGKPLPDQAQRISCDGVALSVGWAPTSALLYQAHAKMIYDDNVEQFRPTQLDDSLFAAGRVNGVFDLQDQIADGQRAGLAAAKYLGQFDGEVPQAITHRGAPPNHPYPIIGHPKKKCFVEFDEDLQEHDCVNAHKEGYDNIELFKRYTTVGMGPSQGKLANMNAIRILARLNGKSIGQTGSTTSRPFHQPVSIGHLAGRRFHPMANTPMHNWHARANVEFVHAGTWYRPEYYKQQGKNRDDCILEEATNVRKNVGMIDVGTLGKLYIYGKDAVAFLERMYTGKFTKLKVGRYRYCVACDETGVVMEDGVLGRLADDRFYLTATSSGAAGVYRDMLRWALLWNMDVQVTNATGQITAMNIAGPRSREVLGPLTDIDLSAEAFPYVGVRQGQVAGAPVMLMRVGFVGELGYEVHVPASCGLHVWSALMDAGKELGIKPFGLEAQRLLRLEKGHIIITQDTDALTNPFEAKVDWALGKDKPFYLGQRSLVVTKKQKLLRQLVGLSLADDPQGSTVEENHLVIQDNKIAGRLTSVAKRSTLGYPLAMGLLRPDLTEPGTKVRVRIGDGQLIEAKVVELPFYDPENARQN